MFFIFKITFLFVDLMFNQWAYQKHDTDQFTLVSIEQLLINFGVDFANPPLFELFTHPPGGVSRRILSLPCRGFFQLPPLHNQTQLNFNKAF